MNSPDVAAALDGSARWALVQSDCLDVLRGLPDGCVDALLTDPPAGISFLSLEFDSDRGGRAQWVAWLAAILAECRRVMKPWAHALVWALPRTAHWTATAVEDAGLEVRDVVVHLQGQGFPKSKALLKPAAEHWILARAPGPVAPLQIDVCRIGTSKEVPASPSKKSMFSRTATHWEAHHTGIDPNVGRYPANAVFSHADGCGDACVPDCPVALLDAQSGVLASGAMTAGTPRKNLDSYSGHFAPGHATRADIDGDRGGASRFFWCSKSKGAERKGNPHPCCKPLDLMRWLCRLITPPGGVVLDCFAGSGRTLEAALLEQCRAIGIEREAEYAEYARTSCDRAARQQLLPLAADPQPAAASGEPEAARQLSLLGGST